MPIEPCVVYWANTSWIRPSHFGLLTEEERFRGDRYHRQDDRSRFVVAAVLLRLVVGLRIGVAADRVEIDRACARCGAPHGRPRVVGHDIEVSVSHSGEFAGVAATSAGPVGVDIEHVRPIDFAALGPELCAPGESVVPGCPSSFYCLWTRKESVLKASGVGLNLPMAAIRVTPWTEPPRLISYASGSPPSTQMTDMSPAEGYAGAVTVITSGRVAFHDVHAVDLLDAV